MNKKKCVFLGIAAIALVALVCFSYKPLKNYFDSLEEYSSSGFLMDTTVNVKVKGMGSEETAEMIFSQIQMLEDYCYSKTIEGSDVYSVNNRSSYEVEDITLEAIKKSLDICKKSNGALDIAIGGLVNLWNVNSPDAKVPEESVIQSVAGNKYGNVTISGNTVSLANGAIIDLGAVAKGAACDKVRELVESAGIRRAVVSIGGSVMLYGKGDFTVGIADPQKGSTGYIATLTLGDCFVSTSGTYERYFDYDGVRYHHILDPVTGYPVQNGLSEVTVISDSGLVSDALSTACFVLGIEEGIKLCEEYGCEAVFIAEQKQIYTTAGFLESVTITDTTYSFA